MVTKALISRGKMLAFSTLCCVEITEISSHNFWQNIRESNFLLKNFWWRKISCFSTLHTVKIAEIYSNRKKYRQINYVEISLAKMLFSRNFCQKSVKVNFRNFHTALCTMHTSVALFSWNQIMVVVVVQFFLLTQTRVRKAGLERNVKRRKLWCYITQPFFFLMVHWFFSCHPWLILNNVHTCRYFC